MDEYRGEGIISCPELWNFSRSSVTKAVNKAYRKRVRRGLGMSQRDSLCQRLTEFKEADVKMKHLQLRFMKRATESQNRLVGSMSWHVYRHSMLGRGINEEMNIFSTRYKDILIHNCAAACLVIMSVTKLSVWFLVCCYSREFCVLSGCELKYIIIIIIIIIVVLNQISLVCKVYYKYRKQTLLQKYLDHHGCLERRHDFTKDPSRSQKHCFL